MRVGDGSSTASADAFIDIHAHEYPQEFLEACARPDSGLECLVERDRVIVRQDGAVALGAPRPAPSLQDRLRAMDEAGVALQVLSVSAPNVYRIPSPVRIPLARTLNDRLVDLARRAPDRLRVFASLPLPDLQAALTEVGRALAEPMVVGFVVCTTVDRRPLDDAWLEPLWDELSGWQAVVFVHPTTGCCTDGIRDYALSLTIDYMAETTNAIGRLLFSGVFERYPGIRWVFSHAGGSLPYVVHRFGEYTAQFPECRARLTQDPVEILGRLNFDTVTTHAPALRCAIETFGARRFLFGTDYPHLPRGVGAFVDTLAAVGLGPEDHDRVARGNARALLGLG